MSRRDDRDEPSGLIEALLEMLREMEERGEQRRTGRGRVGRNVSFDYSVDIGGLAGAGADADAPGSSGGQTDRDADVSADEPPHVTTRETDDGMVVAADLPGVEGAAVDTRLDRDAGVFVVEVNGREAARLPLDDDGWTVTGSRFSNGVLEVQLSRD